MSALSDQTTALLAQAAMQRQEIFGGSGQIQYAGYGIMDGYWSPVKSQQQLQEAGFMGIHDTIVRVLKSNLPTVTIGSLINLYDGNGQLAVTVRHKENGTANLINPEWVMGCSAEFH
jgi:hypothetical protein